MKSDLVLDISKFAPEAVTNNTHNINAHLMKLMDGTPNWWEVGAAKYRQMREDGETPLPKPIELPQGKNIKLPSRESGREIPCRYFVPEKEGSKVAGVYMHIHGGGWVLMNERTTDPLLQNIANAKNYVVISVGYRLAPEYPFPAGPEDCYDVAEHLIAHGKEQFGDELRMMGGESAGAHLVALTTFYLLRKYPSLHLSALVLTFGIYDLSLLPNTMHMPDKLPILSFEHMSRFIDAFAPGQSIIQLRHPDLSPFYANLNDFRGRLPKALFLVGTNDLLLDDSMMMSVKWHMAGGEAIVRVVPGAPHAFISQPADQVGVAKAGLDAIFEFLAESN